MKKGGIFMAYSEGGLSASDVALLTGVRQQAAGALRRRPHHRRDPAAQQL